MIASHRSSGPLHIFPDAQFEILSHSKLPGSSTLLTR